MPKQFDGYVRVSRRMGRGGDSYYTLEDQEKRIRGWAASRGVEIAALHVDDDVSGGGFDRPGLNTAMDRIRAHRVDGIAVAYIDRLSRAGVGDALALVEEISEHGGELAAVDQGLDPTTAMGEFGMTLMLALARMQRRRLTEGWDTAVANAVERGAYPAEAPYGYSKGEDSRLYPNPDEKDFLRGIFLRRAKGDTWARIIEWLEAEGAKPRRADKWIATTIRDMIPNRVYLGEISKQGHFNGSAHEALVSLSEFEAAQNVLGITQSSNAGGEGQLLSGLIRCAGCSYSVAASSYGRAGQQKRQYVCKRRHGGGVCPAPVAAAAGLIEDHIVGEFFAYVDDVSAQAINGDAGELVAARDALDRAEALLRAFADDLEAQAILGHQQWLEALRTRQSAAAAAREAYDSARKAHSATGLPDAATLRATWPELSIPERRRLIAAAMDCVFLRKGQTGDMPGRTKIFWKGTGPEGLSRKGRSVPIRSLSF